MVEGEGIGVYVHIPFCVRRCPYCAFVSFVGKDHLMERYSQAVCAEIRMQRSLAERGALTSLYFGGGTPTHLKPSLLREILSQIRAVWSLSENAEITVEANPGTCDHQVFSALRQAGFNRVSLGIQSFDDEELLVLGRIHDGAEARRSFETCRDAGFNNVSLDLIFGVPGSSPIRWKETLDEAIRLGPEHLSVYALAVEEQTELADRIARGALSVWSEEDEAHCYEWTIDSLAEAGYAQYEVSNFARQGRWSRHNWGYWTGKEYLGVGASAHSFLKGTRSWNQSDLEAYIDAVEKGNLPGLDAEAIDHRAGRTERLWLGLRTVEGVRLDRAERRRLDEENVFDALEKAGYLTYREGRLRLTKRGFSVADSVALEVVDILA